ncbi:MAG: hypothetical protein M4D80_40435 [Myxococcota bacterium]|nr:hypothetical protein [Deltaproteobacteria bacterium]MDQ3341465.1 hypothetical protein [Myxococcota bacterium]
MRAALLALALLTASLAQADPPPKRPVPAYDGRAQAPTTAGDVARTTLRVLLFPIRIVIDYGVRWPLGELISAVENVHGVRRAVRNLFLRPPTPTLTFVPLAFYDFGFQSPIGLRAVWRRGFLSPGSSFAVKLGTGGADFWRGDFGLVIAVPQTHGFRFGVEASARRRPDQQFFGIGPRSPHAARARYLHARFGVLAHLGWRELSMFAATAVTFTAASYFNGGPSIEDRVATGGIAALPAGYDGLVGTERFGATLALDTREAYDSPEVRENGARLDALVERVRARDIGHWLHVDATLGIALRLDPPGEYKLDVRLRMELVEPSTSLADDEVPFFELATIGGARDLRGLANGRGRGLSAAALTVDYQWPLAAWLDTTLYVGAGNVYDGRFSNLTAGSLRGSFGMGLSLAGFSYERQIELWAAVGTDPFDEGANVSSFRLVFGYSRDY